MVQYMSLKKAVFSPLVMTQRIMGTDFEDRRKRVRPNYHSAHVDGVWR